MTRQFEDSRPARLPQAVKLGLPAAITVFLLCGCSLYTAPGGGVAKGCTSSEQVDGPLSEGLGISSHLEWGSDDVSAAYREFETQKWQEMGLRAMRRDMSWRRLEPEPGQWQWEGLDRIVTAAESTDVDFLGILNYGNSWARSDGETSAPPDDVTDFGNYAEQVALRYAGRVKHYEVWNEQNIGITFWRPTEDPEGYAELLVEASARVRAADPEALISFGGVFGPQLLFNTDGETFIRQVIEVLPDLSDHIDMMAFHPYRYPFTAPEVATDLQRSLATEICDMRELLADMGSPDMPMWITELGWHTAQDALAPGTDAETQGAWLVRGALIAFAQGVDRFYWYTFRDSGTSEDFQEERFGLFTYDEDPTSAPEAQRTSADEFATLVSMLGDHVRVTDRSEILGLDEFTWALELGGAEEGVGPATTVLWTTSDPLTVRLPREGQASLWDTAGEELRLESSEGAWEVPVSGRPVYLVRH